jgi:hypothetical protein
MSEEREKNYKDFLEKKPQLVMKVSSKQTKLMMEHGLIIKNLGEKEQMTVKEIHELYWDKMKEKHGKTLKTIYRYMDLLEKANIVQVAGHRKPKGSHLTEKLYSRTAIIYFEEEAQETKWWRDEEGMKQFEMIWKVSKKFFGLEEEKMKDYANVIDDYYQEREENIREILVMIEGNKELAEELQGISIIDFKNIVTTISMLKIFSKDGKARKKLDELI